MPGRAVSYKARRALPTASGLAQAPAGALQAGARPGSPRGSEGTLQAIAFTSLCFWTQVAEARQDDGLGPTTPTPWRCALPAPVPGTWLPPPPPPVLVTRVHLSSPQQGGRSLSLLGGWQVERQRMTPASGSPRWNSGRHAARLALTAESCHLEEVQPEHLHVDRGHKQALEHPARHPHRLPARCQAGPGPLGPPALGSPCLTPLKTETEL